MYKLLRPVLFRFDAERVHNATSKIAERLSHAWVRALTSKLYGFEHPSLRVNVCGIDFPNPVGLAAGYDKNGKMIDFLSGFGFGFLEVGTVTPRPQEGNLKPRLFHLRQQRALFNRMGFNNEGVEALVIRLQKRKSSVIIGANIGKNKDTPNENAWQDYVHCFKAIAQVVDYAVVNVSSPNTPNLRELLEKHALEEILGHIQGTETKKIPVFLKIAPELSEAHINDIVQVAKKAQIAGIIATNTLKIEGGGLSGRPLQQRSLEVIRSLYRNSRGALPIIGVGGIFSAQDAYEKIKAGASLVQVYTGLIYEGPALVQKIKKGLVTLLTRDGFSSIAEAVGKSV